jgi:phosphate transport system substrate-binding protein
MKIPIRSFVALLTGVLLPMVALLSNRPVVRATAFAYSDSGPAVALLGTGASFPAPLYEKWFSEYNRIHPGVQINYQALGSGAGIKQFQQGLVNFAASDAAMTDAQIATVKDGVVMLPLTAGSVVLAYNLPGGPGELRLSRQAYTRIFLGTITHWDDPAILNANPGKQLPHIAIVVITKSDASGTTFVFTSHLSAISEAWRNGPGAGTAVNFPVGIAAKGTLGVTALIGRTPGAIGYVEYAYAKQTGLPVAVLENKSGKFVGANLAAGAAALASIRLPPNLRAWLPDPPGDGAYPIVTYTWILCRRHYADPNVAAALKAVIRYCLGDGQSYAADLGYIPLPAEVIKAVTKALDRIS